MKSLCAIFLSLIVFSSVSGRNVRLLLPEKIYAVPGIECNLYFDNIVTVINPNDLVFDIDCKVGRTDQKRWRFTPEGGHVGTYPLQLKVFDENGVVAEGKTEIVVVPREAGAGRKCSFLLLGASQTAARGYPDRLFELMQQANNPAFHMIGTNSSNYTKVQPGKVAHEGYGGWGWRCFFTRHVSEESARNDGLDPRRAYLRTSRFLFPKDGKMEFDFKKYCEKYNESKAPDMIVVMLGINNIFLAESDEEVDKNIAENVTPYMERMVREFRGVNPNVHIAFSTLTPGAASQDAFGCNYKNLQTRWRWRRNLDRYHRMLFVKAKELDVGLIPLYIAVDGENGFPTRTEDAHAGNPAKIVRQSNAMHPNPSGYRQMGDALYSYVKYVMSKK